MSDRTVEIAAGICPSCETAGTAGTPCPQAVCARRGYHFVPAEYYSGSTAADALVGRRADEYLIVRRIGKGGFGSVYLALQLPILLKCALKVLHESIEEQPGGDALMAKFRGEAEALARLNHPNIVRLIRFGEFEHRPYLVMEFIEGRSLRDEMRKAGADRRAISRTVVDKLMVQMLHGLEAAHAISIVHRDMKPENVLLQSVIGNPWYVRIVDFGLAKFTAAGTHTSVLSGTPAYMAPEQLIGQGICPASDVYAMGIIAYELLTGRRMYLGEGQDSILASKLNPGYCPFDSVDRTGLTDGELAFLQRATCHRSDDRFRTAGTMLEAWQGLQDARGQAAVVTVPVAAQPGQSTPTLGTLPHPSEPAASGEAAEGEGALHLLEQSDRFGRVGKASSSEVTPATAIGGTLQRSKGLRTAAWLAVGLAIAAAALVVLAMSGIFRKAPDGEPPGRAVVASKESRDSESGLGRPAGVPPDVRGPERLHEPDVLAPIDGGAAQPSPDIVGGLRPDVQPRDVQPAQAPDVQPRGLQPAQTPDVQPRDVQPAQAPDVRIAAPDVRPSDVSSPPSAAEVRGQLEASPPGGTDSTATRASHAPASDDARTGPAKKDAGKKDAGKKDGGDAQVTIRIETVPSGALVYAGGRPIGETPLDVPLAKGAKVTLRLERAGFKTATLPLSGDKGGKRTVELEPDSF